MLSASDLEKRIRTTRDVGDIVNAMKAYAGVTLRKTGELVLNIREYEDSLFQAMADITAHHPKVGAETPAEGRRILVAFGSSQGLCGPYNDRVADAVSGTARQGDALFVIGRRLKSAMDLRNIRYSLYRDSTVSISGIETALAEAIPVLTEEYSKEEYLCLTFVFSCVEEKRAAIHEERILPPDLEKVRAMEATGTPPLIYLPPDAIFENVLEEFLYVSLYRCYLESLRTENWYRLRSLEGASQNIENRLSELRSLLNYARQEEITEEMLEILGSGMFYGPGPA